MTGLSSRLSRQAASKSSSVRKPLTKAQKSGADESSPRLILGRWIIEAGPCLTGLGEAWQGWKLRLRDDKARSGMHDSLLSHTTHRRWSLQHTLKLLPVSIPLFLLDVLRPISVRRALFKCSHLHNYSHLLMLRYSRVIGKTTRACWHSRCLLTSPGVASDSVIGVEISKRSRDCWILAPPTMGFEHSTTRLRVLTGGFVENRWR